MKALLIALFAVASIGSVSAQVKCVPDGRGGMCCWDVQQSGPFRPIGC
jgi:hypothetical protein